MMKTKQKLRTLYAIATMAVENGLDITVELADRNNESKALNGFLSNTAASDDSVILRAYHPDPAPPLGEDPEDEDATEDNGQPPEDDTAGFDMAGF